MHSTTDCISQCEERIARNALERQQLQEVASLAAKVQHLLVCNSEILKDVGIRKEMRQLEEWLDSERKGPAPAGIVSESGVLWLIKLRDKLKLVADEAQRMENEGAPPASREQRDKIENILCTVHSIDEIINEDSAKPH